MGNFLIIVLYLPIVHLKNNAIFHQYRVTFSKTRRSLWCFIVKSVYKPSSNQKLVSIKATAKIKAYLTTKKWNNIPSDNKNVSDFHFSKKYIKYWIIIIFRSCKYMSILGLIFFPHILENWLLINRACLKNCSVNFLSNFHTPNCFWYRNNSHIISLSLSC